MVTNERWINRSAAMKLENIFTFPNIRNDEWSVFSCFQGTNEEDDVLLHSDAFVNISNMREF